MRYHLPVKLLHEKGENCMLEDKTGSMEDKCDFFFSHSG